MSSKILSRLAAAWLAAIAIGGNAPALAAEPLHVGATYITSGLDPAKGSNGWALVSHGVGENLFTVDRDGRLVPALGTYRWWPARRRPTRTVWARQTPRR